MAPILYMQNFSGPVRSVLLTAAALGIKLQHKIIDLSKQEHLTDSFLKVGGLVLFRVDLTTALPAEPPTHNTDARRQWDRHLGQSCHQCLSGGRSTARMTSFIPKTWPRGRWSTRGFISTADSSSAGSGI
jgi:hypothetical protein